MFLLILIYLIILAIDLPPLIREKNKHDLTIYCIFFLFVCTLSVLRTLGIPVPSIMVLLGSVMTKAGLSY